MKNLINFVTSAPVVSEVVALTVVEGEVVVIAASGHYLDEISEPSD